MELQTIPPQAGVEFWKRNEIDGSSTLQNPKNNFDAIENFSSGRVNKLDSEMLDFEIMSILEEPLIDSLKLFNIQNLVRKNIWFETSLLQTPIHSIRKL
ncbi:hypothetical protein AYI68_g5398 [Smittium mucronatum]|uniref:Uncharacterized protein n=1 Tax=Smittium mucronatum TaxID=133383 RepID=A0A1R0GUC8_9FUNG|nr:hypothetical protein AYI68_g5398 [Smittium mucronatum]